MSDPADFLPSASIAMLRARAVLLAKVRRFFNSRGFLEVETPILSHDTVVDRHLDPLRVTLFRDPREPELGDTLWLQTSPEFGMKRLLVALASPSFLRPQPGNALPRSSATSGAQPDAGLATDSMRQDPHPNPLPQGEGTGESAPLGIYQITRAFRGGEVGSLHNPEFTLLEWYRIGDDYAAGMQLLADFAEELLALGPPERLTYREAFKRYATVDPLPLSEIERDEILVTRIEPNLGFERPTILYDYPASQAALAQVRAGDPPVAERFELYARGMELANGYHELLDPAVLRERNRRANAERRADGKYELPEQSRLLAAMEHGLPKCSGTALGIDRLLMAIAGAQRIEEVLALPIDRA
jgi:lysyl-tRNA synthetase class 2